MCRATQLFLLKENEVPGLSVADGQPHCDWLPKSTGPSFPPWGRGVCQSALLLLLPLFPTGHSKLNRFSHYLPAHGGWAWLRPCSGT